MARLSDYIFTIGDIVRSLNRGFSVIAQASMRDYIGVALVIGAGIGLRVLFEFSYEAIFFWLFAASLFYWKLDSRIAISGTLICLVLIPLMLVLFNTGILSAGEEWAEQAAIWAFYFLIIGVSKLFVEHWSESERYEDHDDLTVLQEKPRPASEKKPLKKKKKRKHQVSQPIPQHAVLRTRTVRRQPKAIIDTPKYHMPTPYVVDLSTMSRKRAT